MSPPAACVMPRVQLVNGRWGEEGGGKDRGGNKRMEMQEKQWSVENVPK